MMKYLTGGDPRLIELRQGSHIWTAVIQDGGITYTSVTEFNANLSREFVLGEIKRRAHGLRIDLVP